MNISNKNIDNGKSFDWGRASEDYSKYRDIYPQEFYDKIVARNLCINGQTVLDLGTGTGVLPRNMYRYGAKWKGIDISENQIEYAKKLSRGMDIEYYALSAENINFSDNSFDIITACQCFWYFNHEKIMPNLHRMLNANGRIVALCMEWLPYEDALAYASEKLILKYNDNWSGAGETVHSIEIPKCYNQKFEIIYKEEYPLNVHFTRESWNGRIKSCRGIGASLSKEEIAMFEKEHMDLLCKIAPEEFDVKHYVAIAELKAIK
jgi:2-polyprenyl-3-methyl-5-hydroxy-6-metoxy-1,4-benzoquinol methylase